MAGIPNPMLWGGGDPLDELGKIERSVRVRSSAAASWSRTFSAPTDGKKFTVLFRVKRAKFGAQQELLSANSGQEAQFCFKPDDSLWYYPYAYGLGNPEIFTARLFRDPAAFYEIHLNVDLNNVTPTERMVFYVDGIRQAVTEVQASLGYTSAINAAVTHYIGRYATSAQFFLDAYIAHAILVDGQVLPPSAFGQFHPRTGQWRPKSKAAIRASVAAGGGPRNGWGANGFFLPFDDTTSLVTLGYDRSQSDTDTTGNNWTATNISLTPGNTQDSMLDTPTNVFCTWNPLVPGDSAKSNGNLTAAGAARGTIDASAIPCQWEITANAATVVGGVASESGTASTIAIPNGSTYGFRLSGGTLEYTTNGSSWTSVATGLSGSRLPYASGGSNTLNCGQRPSAYALSPGFRRLSTKNLPLFSGAVTTSGAFTGNLSADGPLVWMNGSPETLMINGNPVTWGVHAERLANGFKMRTASSSYNNSGSNNWTATILSPSLKSLFRYQNAKGN